ncbi:hypothetical protein V6N12_069666 [Hibiscus sabdariffa]|uniref:RNase H type-1 domain-containing protein n=1 Tax=Hibiscus sabdariffa TaxID=183260 RepID=A0ABR2FEK9_9ROSI
MDRLGLSITDVVASNEWTPFRFTKNETLLSHLFFADNLILYAKADPEQARRIANILNIFGSSFGHRKLGYLFISRPQVLWVRLLREKYKVLDMLPSSIFRTTCSPLWRALSNAWEDFRSNLAWSLGNGTSVNILFDVWGAWDTSKLSLVYTADAAPHILGVKPPDPHAGPDMDYVNLRQVWRRTVPQCWKNRNEAVFAASSASVDSVLSRSIGWAQYYNDGWLKPALVVHPSSAATPSRKPEPGWLYLNVDGDVLLSNGEATIGGFLRDHTGNFIFSFSKFIGCANSLHAELWSLHVGLQLAWEHGVDFLQVQTDCKQVTQLFQDPHADSSSISLVHSIRQLWQQGCVIDLFWTQRSSNKATDKLARLLIILPLKHLDSNCYNL